MGVLDRIRDVEIPEQFNGLLYGNPGVGKTVLCAQAPAPLFIDWEDSTDSLNNWPELKANCKVLHVRDKQDIDDIVEALEKKSSDPRIADRKTVVIDSFSELDRNTLSALSLAYTKASTTGNRKMHVPFQSDFLENGEYLRSLVLRLKKLDRNVLMTAHVKIENENNDDKPSFTRPDMPPKLYKTITGIMSFVGYMTLDTGMKGEKDDRQVQLRGNKRLVAKTRYGTESVLKNPTLLDILNLKEWK